MLTPDQQKGLDIILERYKAGEKYTCVSGYAGTGKSYLMSHVIAALGFDPEEEVAFATPTGKSALVLTNMGNKNAMTIHRLLYEWYPRPDGTYAKRARPSLGYKLIICDEVSMIPTEMIDTLLAHHGIYVVFCGDPAQLKPVASDQDNHILDYPHVFLHEIMRQAAESDIIQLTMDIRAGKPLVGKMGNDARVLYGCERMPGMYLWADEVICYTNEKRRELNLHISELHGFDPSKLQIGQKIICLRNHWDVCSDKSDPLVNGAIMYITKIHKYGEQRYNLRVPHPVTMKYAYIDAVDEVGGTYNNICVDYIQIVTGISQFEGDLRYRVERYAEYRAREYGEYLPVPLEFDYGWAITCHKAQGSTFGKVLVEEEKGPYSYDEHQRWLYTACTRPSDKLVLIKKEARP